MNTTSAIFMIAGAALLWWALTEFKLIGPNQSLQRGADGKRIPGGYVSPTGTSE